LTTVHIFYGKISVPLILLISFIFTMVVSVLCYKFIEIPSIKIGRKLAAENSRGDISLRKKAS
ncbi:acyltransferase, partial [Bacillus mycoides]